MPYHRNFVERSSVTFAKGLVWYIMFCSATAVFTMLIEEYEFSQRVILSAVVAGVAAGIFAAIGNVREDKR